MTSLDRITIYAVLCFISICSFFMGSPNNESLMPLVGLFATVAALWAEFNLKKKKPLVSPTEDNQSQ
ncbi:hypothetical protein R8Z52_02425 [Vibrio porteresiae DSM 19223]|uniref:Uncharacterized protein n=1 Tax=Vibrio porteresiae DSM 19223 TaxID=1123496 RepID=A0ABZ0QD83_9VIBR|nr:hypothetical protein [Vibrio porteresiae]WPC74147.1 hypothetical protein R8Z52_02425 [Vibrio porteresiae DSM 19223]